MKFDDLLSIDELNGILDFKFSNSEIPMYLYIRYFILQSNINKSFNLSDPHILPIRSWKDKVRYLYMTVKKNLFLAPNQDVFIFSSGIVNRYQNGLYMNRLYNNFYNLFPNQTLLIEYSNKKKYPLPKVENVYYRDFIELLSSCIGKFFKINKRDREGISKFLNYLAENNQGYLDKSILLQIEKNLKSISRRLPVQIFLYKLFFKMKNVKLLIVEDGHYGLQSHIFYIAHSLGIKTAEFQHGYISKSHPAYNYSEKIYNEIKKFLPNYFLSHGIYWSHECRTPSNNLEIGFPDLIESVKKYNDVKKGDMQKILFMSGGTSIKEFNDIVEQIAKFFTSHEYEFIIRPHPSEISAVDERYGYLKEFGVTIDDNNLYASLNRADIVIGVEHSTVFFEAVFFTKRIYILKSDYTLFYNFDSVFISFENAEELIKLINEEIEIKHNADYFWDSNWKQNYIDFIENTIGINK
ncbi:hypothetical protein N5T98_10720 [Aliarcobacter cryaerophilus]|uniref:hypothetical protein n=1 Tax=Aliarcobacter cryaerophilus TaxID=28198 RepID=UPI0021B4F5D8|nr:hypothetical protein [Aliarcobacter cryaerophilus]MCT7487115.1 hypothetical protein [Aliarcobacter cryaerophilus]MCT7491571.1 hypothetical protein [Aliarcobacter cryaerophilus]